MRNVFFKVSDLFLYSFVISIFALSPNFLYAQESLNKIAEKPVSALPPVDLTNSFFTMFKGLAICLALLFALIWVLKKIKSPIVTGQGKKLKIIERLPISAKSSLLLVEVNKKQMLIGVGSDPVRLISDFINVDSIENLHESFGNEGSAAEFLKEGRKSGAESE